MADKATFSLDSDDPYLSPDERKVVRRLLSHPEDFPQEFWSAVNQKVALDGEPIPASQIQGGKTLPFYEATIINSLETTTSTTFTDLSTIGPTLTNLSDGSYLVIGEASCHNDTDTLVSIMALQINDTAPSGDSTTLFTAGTSSTQGAGVLLVDLRNNNNNTLTCKYRVNGASTGTWFHRRLYAFKVGN